MKNNLNLEEIIRARMTELKRMADRVLPIKVGEAAVTHVRENFRNSGMDGQQWKEPLRRTLGFAGANAKKGTLIGSTVHLMNSIDYEPQRAKALVRAPVEYAASTTTEGVYR